jgi:xanthomonalisin
MADVQAYFTAVNQPLNVPIVIELLGGTSGACPGDCDDGEEAVDIQQIISMAPGASVLIVYEDTSGNADIDIFNAYATDNIAKQMSFSFGIGDGNAASDEQEFAEFHAQGQNFFVASGDEGANLGDGGWPGFSQNVTDVGGTDLTTASAGGAWSSETGWVGSGTGWCDSSNSVTPCYQSPYDAIPSYQAPVITSQNGGSTKYRNLPDISAEANTDNFWCSSGTCQGGIGGTSLAAPRWAGFLALVNEQAATNGETVGFLNPLVYTIGQGSGYDTAFHDITTGSNPSGSTVPAGFTGSRFRRERPAPHRSVPVVRPRLQSV